MTNQHWLKTVQPHFEAVWAGRKPFDLRRNDRGFQCGDILHLVEYDPDYRSGLGGLLTSFELNPSAPGDITGRRVDACVSYVLTADTVKGLKAQYVILGLAAPKNLVTPDDEMDDLRREVGVRVRASGGPVTAQGGFISPSAGLY